MEKSNTNNKCIKCNKTLVKIGTSRQNGTYRHNDWEGRKYHKKCYKEIATIERMNELLEKYKNMK